FLSPGTTESLIYKSIKSCFASPSGRGRHVVAGEGKCLARFFNPSSFSLQEGDGLRRPLTCPESCSIVSRDRANSHHREKPKMPKDLRSFIGELESKHPEEVARVTKSI